MSITHRLERRLKRQPQNVPHPALPGTIWATADRDGPRSAKRSAITFRDGGEVTTYTSTVARSARVDAHGRPEGRERELT